MSSSIDMPELAFVVLHENEGRLVRMRFKLSWKLFILEAMFERLLEPSPTLEPVGMALTEEIAARSLH